jgi:hypothetical protein
LLEKTNRNEALECDICTVNDKVSTMSNDIKELLEDLRLEQLETA